MQSRRRICVALITVGLWIGSAAAAPLFTLSADGRSFEYVARAGDYPSRVAEMFGISSQDLQAFLTANHIDDATRVGPGFIYRIPNPIALRAERLQSDNARLQTEATSSRARVTALEQELEGVRTNAKAAEERADRFAGFASRWPFVRAGLVVLVLITAAALALAAAAARRQREAVRYAQTLAAELEEKRKTNLADRQERERHILDLENSIRTLEAKLGPRVVVSGR
jgi:hypothetical protein